MCMHESFADAWVRVHVHVFASVGNTKAKQFCTYSVCNKPVRSILISISLLFTLSSDSACQISPQDFLKNTISFNNDSNKTTAAGVVTDKRSINCLIVVMVYEYKYDGLDHYGLWKWLIFRTSNISFTAYSLFCHELCSHLSTLIPTCIVKLILPSVYD